MAAAPTAAQPSAAMKVKAQSVEPLTAQPGIGGPVAKYVKVLSFSQDVGTTRVTCRIWKRPGFHVPDFISPNVPPFRFALSPIARLRPLCSIPFGQRAEQSP